MIIAADDSLIHYSLKYAFTCDDSQEVNYICQRVNECVPRMQRATTGLAIQVINDYFERADPDYLKSSPLKRLLESLELHAKVFVS